MSTIIRNQRKIALRQKIKEVLSSISSDSVTKQSASITKQIISLPAFQWANRISIYLSMGNEINTTALLEEMFRLGKQVFVPSYSGKKMIMLKVADMDDFLSLPLTKWNIRQPNPTDDRENGNENGGIDLVLLPGVAFTRTGGRMGHGMGYYDKYLADHFAANPNRYRPDLRGNIEEKLKGNHTVLVALSLKEQIIDETELPLDAHDILLDQIVTSE